MKPYAGLTAGIAVVAVLASATDEARARAGYSVAQESVTGAGVAYAGGAA